MTTQVQDNTSETAQGEELSFAEALEKRIQEGGPPELYRIILDWFCTYCIQASSFDEKRWLSKRVTRHLKTKADALRKAKQAVASLGHPLNVFLAGDTLAARIALSDSEHVGCGFVFYPAKTEHGEAVLNRDHEFMPCVNEHGYPVVARVVPESPADHAHFRPGDVVVSIDGRSARGHSIAQLTERIDDHAGTTVLVRRSVDKHALSIMQKSTPVPVSCARFGDIGYIRISTFLPNDMPEQVEAALQALKDCNAIVLDVRGSPGGPAAINVRALSLFLESGEAFHVVNDGENPFEMTYRIDGGELTLTRSGGHVQVDPRLPYLLEHRPLYILVDGNTRSAPEAFSQSLRDHQVATLVGSRTFGKGVVQGKIEVLKYAVIEALFGRWISPAGIYIGDGGVTSPSGIVPDVTVPSTDGALFGGKGDRVLEITLALATKGHAQ